MKIRLLSFVVLTISFMVQAQPELPRLGFFGGSFTDKVGSGDPAALGTVGGGVVAVIGAGVLLQGLNKFIFGSSDSTKESNAGAHVKGLFGTILGAGVTVAGLGIMYLVNNPDALK
jgi:hypothetical protein